VLSALPILKLFQLAVYTLYSSQCPWKEQMQARYMLMLLVTIATIYQTVMVCILLSIAKGWFVSRSLLSQDALSTVTLFMGGVYLCYSAFYVSVNVDEIRNTILVALDVLYMVLFVALIKFSLKTKEFIDDQATMYVRENAEQLIPQIRLKQHFLSVFIWIGSIYFLGEIIMNGIVPVIKYGMSSQGGDTLT
jgi:hypothetical protein